MEPTDTPLDPPLYANRWDKNAAMTLHCIPENGIPENGIPYIIIFSRTLYFGEFSE